MSKKNQDTWAFAHSYFGKLLVPVGSILLLLTIGAAFIAARGTFVFVDADPLLDSVIAGVIAFGVQLIIFFVLVFLTERALRKEFHSNGERRQ